jgi:hypothetical protein
VPLIADPRRALYVDNYILHRSTTLAPDIDGDSSITVFVQYGAIGTVGHVATDGDLLSQTTVVRLHVAPINGRTFPAAAST